VSGSKIAAWKENCLQGNASAAKQSKKERSQAQPARNEVKQLKRELRRKDKALAETAALLVLRKKMHAIWGDYTSIRLWGSKVSTDSGNRGPYSRSAARNCLYSLRFLLIPAFRGCRAGWRASWRLYAADQSINIVYPAVKALTLLSIKCVHSSIGT